MNNQKTWVEINSQNLLHNINEFRNRVGGQVKVCGVIKSNAYGYGLVEVVSIIKDRVDFLAVDSVDEAIKINKLSEASKLSELSKKTPILILGYTIFERLEDVVKNGFHQVVANLETLERLKIESEKLKITANIHLKIETGTSRQGIFLENIDDYLKIIKDSQFLDLAGISTHYANIEDTTDDSYSKFQLEIYKKTIDYINNSDYSDLVNSDLIKHTACSAAAALYPNTYFDMIRLGISMYGLWSSETTKVSASEKKIEINLKPALTWKTKVAHLKVLSAGTAISYGCTEKVSQDTKVAVLPVGYWDGFDRGLSSVGQVLVNGQRCRVLGRVCMNMIIVDVSHLDSLKLEDEVVLLGEQGSEVVTAEEIAAKIGTINYEIITRINPKIKRIVV